MLVQADRQHARICVEGLLHAIRVVHVEVDVGDPFGTLGKQPIDRDRGPLYTQNPLAAARIAWCRPPARFAACPATPPQTALAAATLAPATSADTSCIPANTGLSMVPRPAAGSGASVSPARRTAAM